VDSKKLYPLEEAVKILTGFPRAKFNETVELAFHLGVDPRQSDQMVRGTVALPHGSGKTVRVLVFAKSGPAADAAREAGAEYVGFEDMIKKCQEGWTDFDVAIATPDMMGLVGPLGRVLGPRGLMPSPRAGTVTTDVASAVKEYKAGKVEFRADAGGIVHCVIGKLSFGEAQLIENAEALLRYVRSLKPAASKGVYVRGVTLSATMSPGIQVAA